MAKVTALGLEQAPEPREAKACSLRLKLLLRPKAWGGGTHRDGLACKLPSGSHLLPGLAASSDYNIIITLIRRSLHNLGPRNRGRGTRGPQVVEGR